jgi:hypothetical protein
MDFTIPIDKRESLADQSGWFALFAAECQMLMSHRSDLGNFTAALRNAQ